jgi:hypothetical protein
MKPVLENRARSMREVDNLTAICKPIVYTMWDPQHHTTLCASRVCYANNFTLHLVDIEIFREKCFKNVFTYLVSELYGQML